MRVFSSVVTVFPIYVMRTGQQVHKELAWSVSTTLSQVLELGRKQRKTAYLYLIGRKTLDQLDDSGVFTPADLKSISDFKAWYNCEFSGWIKSTGHLVVNLKTGSSVVFTHNWL